MAGLDANLTSAPTHSDVSSLTTAVVTDSPAAAGTKVVVFASWFNASAATTTIADNSGLGLSYSLIGTVVNGSDRIAIFQADAPSGLPSGTTITATHSLASQGRSLSALSLTGVATGTATDGFSSSNAGVPGWTGGTVNTTNASDVVVGFGMTDGATTTSGPLVNYTEVGDYNDGTATDSWETVYRVVSSTGAYSAGGTFAASGALVLGGQVAFKAAAGATPALPRPLLMMLNRIRPFTPPLRANPGLVFLSSGQTLLLGTVTEVEAAIAFAKLKVKAMQLNAEADAVLVLAQRKALTLAQATETDTNLAFGKFKVKALPVGTEIDSAISLPGKKVKALALVTETDAALAFTRLKGRILSVVSEADAAIAFGKFKVKAFTLASETDTALPFTRVKTRLLAVATEADSALAFTKKKVKALGVITETDLALAITRLISGQHAALATVLETDAVLAFVRLKRKALGQATEADTSVPLAGRKVKAVTLATEADSTLAAGRQKARTITPASAVNAALPFVLRKVKQVTQVTETDSAIAIIRKVLSVVINPRATFSGTGPSAGVVSTGSRATVVGDDAVTAEFSADPTADTVGDQ